MKVLVTGCAGFIGYHLSKRLCIKSEKNIVFGIDNMNNYYDVQLKKSRLKDLKLNKNFNFKKINICNYNALNKFISQNNIKFIIHLAAQAGVRHSIKYPQSYFKNNIYGFNNILEVSRINKVKHLLFASTSSVYGNSNKFPLKETDNTSNPLSFYAASKKSNEVCAFSYSNIYKIPITGLRFFTVYGPYGRPDMSLFKFVRNILNGKKIDLYNKGDHVRDFTYVEDVAKIIFKITKKIPKKSEMFRIINIASSEPVELKYFLEVIENITKLKFKINLLPMQVGDVKKTHADNRKLIKLIGKYKFTRIKKGIPLFIKWYKKFYKLNLNS